MSALPLRVVQDVEIPPQNSAEYAALAFLVRYRVETTRKGYALALRQWFQHCEDHFLTPLGARRQDIEIWARHLEEREGLSLSTVGTKLTALAGFYRLAQADGLIEKDPMTHVRRPYVERVSTTNGVSRPELAVFPRDVVVTEEVQAHLPGKIDRRRHDDA